MSNYLSSSVYLTSKLMFHDNDGEDAIVIDVDAGTVQLSEKYRDKLDDAAKLFWERVQQAAPLPVNKDHESNKEAKMSNAMKERALFYLDQQLISLEEKGPEYVKEHWPDLKSDHERECAWQLVVEQNKKNQTGREVLQWIRNQLVEQL